MNLNSDLSRFEVGKYLVSPMTRQLDDGRFAASVSIRSGRGSGTHDRVFRLEPRFPSSDAALAHAAEEGRAWIRDRQAALASPLPPGHALPLHQLITLEAHPWPRKN